MGIEFLDLSQIEDTKVLYDSIEQNIQTVSVLRKEVERLKMIVEGQSIKVEKLELDQKKEQNLGDSIKPYDLESTLQEEIAYYISELEKLEFFSGKNSVEQVKEILPSKKHVHYQEILTGIKADYLRKMIEIKRFLEEEDMEAKDLEDFKIEIWDLQQKMNRITDIQNNEEEILLEKDENTLIFLPSISGNIYVLGDIDKLNKEYYPDFIDLFQSIQNNTFKNVKKLVEHNQIKGISEVRGYQVRVIFDRIGSKEYVILAAFVKKSDNEKVYREFLEKRIISYRNSKKQLIEKLKDEEFLNENLELTKQLYAKLHEVDFCKIKSLGGVS